AADTSKDPQAGVTTFNPVLKNKGKFTVYSSPITVSSPASFAKSPASSDALQAKINIGTTYLVQNHNVTAADIAITNAYTDTRSGITHLYVRQVVGGVPVSNGLANVNIDKKNRIISSSSSFAPADVVSKVKRDNSGSLVARASETATLKNAFKALTEYVKTPLKDADLSKVSVASVASLLPNDGAKYEITNVPKQAAVDGKSTATKAYIQTAEGKLVPVWEITLQQDSHWWSAHVNQDSNKVEAINDWVRRAESYNVYPRTVNTPAEGVRQIVTNPAHATASPYGWASGSTTTGNNVWAQNNPTGGSTWQNNHRPSAVNGVFDYPMNVNQDPSTYVDAAITQLFYSINVMHDLSYLYGFTEAAGNFQGVNYSGQGAGNDYVVGFAQDGSGTNNAYFATPPDGQNGVMRMFVWTQTSPRRDGDFEQDIVAHEFTHGISNRLTGGPWNANCLTSGEPGGMGEGWSDAVANILRLRPGDTRARNLIMGQYVAGRGIRYYPYSTSTTTNPTSYGDLDSGTFQEVHAIGEIWAEMLYEVIWNLIDARGMAADLFSHDLTKGNSIALQIILD
ncbi:hypothetical protein EC988_006216, partial [Linderina pennispora]